MEATLNMDLSHVPYILSIATAMLSSSVVWGSLQFFMNRRMRKVQAIKEEGEAKQAKLKAQRAEEERTELLAAAQATAQRTALESADTRYAGLMADYTTVRQGLRDLRQASSLVLSAFENFILRLRPLEDGSAYQAVIKTEEVELSRSTISEARRLLF